MWARVGKGQKKLCKNESQIQCDLFIVEQVDVLVSPYNCSTLEQRWRKRARKERFFIRKNISRSKEKTYVPPGKLEITDVPICAAIYVFVTFFLFAIGFSCFERKKEREERGRQGEGGWGEESGRQGESERDEKMRGREKSEKERKKGKRKERRGNAWGWNKMFKKGTRKKNESILPLKRKKWTVTYAGLFYFKKKKQKHAKTHLSGHDRKQADHQSRIEERADHCFWRFQGMMRTFPVFCAFVYSRIVFCRSYRGEKTLCNREDVFETYFLSFYFFVCWAVTMSSSCNCWQKIRAIFF